MREPFWLRLSSGEDESCFDVSLPLYLHRLLDPNSNTEIANYPIYKILFCVRGHDGTPESDCFAFTESHHNTEIFRIHVFRCQIREAVSIQPPSFNQFMKEAVFI